MIFTMNGYDWLVYFVEPNSEKLMRSDGSYTVGMCDRNQQKIFISEMLSGPFLRKVLIHEVCHSAMMSYKIDMSIEQEEILCDLIATYGDEIFEVADDIFLVMKRKIA